MCPKDDPQVGHDARHRSSPVFPHPRGGRPLLRGAIEQAIRDVGVAINQIDDAIDVKVARQGSADDQERDYALCVSFVDDASLRQFISTTLPVIKRQSKLLWKGLVTPVEATVD